MAATMQFLWLAAGGGRYLILATPGLDPVRRVRDCAVWLITIIINKRAVIRDGVTSRAFLCL
jgi:hypothetical protein